MNATWSLGTEHYSIDFTVHVLEPNFTLKDDSIYYGDDADLQPTPNSWQCTSHKTITKSSPEKTAPKLDNLYQYSVSLEKMTACKEDVLAWVVLGGKRVESTNKANVHVLKPVITSNDRTVYLSQSLKLNDCMTVDPTWECDCIGFLELNKKTGTEPTHAPIFSFNGLVSNNEPVVLENCTPYTVTVTINDVDFPLTDINNNFTVHVVKPVITNADTAICLGNTVNLELQMTEGPNWVCNDGKSLPVNEDTARVAPALDHSFSTGNNESTYKPDTCTLVTVTSSVTSVYQTGNVTKDVTPVNDNTFTVHVHVPKFTVTAQDLWADYESNVYLYNDTTFDAITKIDRVWVDRKGDDNTLTATGNTDVANIDFTFSQKNPYKMGDADQDVTINQLTCKVNGNDYTAVEADSVMPVDKQLVVIPVDDTGHDFTIHINKFKVVITNAGKQNAIYLLSNGTKIAVEAGKSTTVAGLICGKEYTISEENDNNWTWRYGAAATAVYSGDKNCISYQVNAVKSEPTESSDSVIMTYGAQTNTKWLSGEACKINNVATPECTVPVRKEEGEENA